MDEEKQLPTIIDVGLVPILDIHRAQQQLKELQEIVKAYLVPGLDYGKQPGTDKDALFQPGAQKLSEIYGFNAKSVIVKETEDWDREPPLFDYLFETTLIRRSDNLIMGYGMGSCNSYESKYKWRQAQRICPDCGKQTIIKGKEEYGGGWLCFGKKGGCGMKFEDDDIEITSQPSGKIPNDDIASQKNTIMKIAKKRSMVDAVISATRSAGIFTQDLEDFLEAEVLSKPQIKIDNREPDPTAEDWSRLKEVGKGCGWAESHMKLWIDSAQKKGLSKAEVYQDALAKFGQPNTNREEIKA